jgi:predicted MFS family arabinose efflux permease
MWERCRFEGWQIALAAAALMALTTGSRSAMGLFMGPLNTATGVGLAGLSLALAVGQLVWGLAQPLTAWAASRLGVARLVVLGALGTALCTAVLPALSSTGSLALAFGLLALAGAASGSNALLLGLVARRVAASARGLASGWVSGGIAVGQMTVAPLAQWVMLGIHGLAALWTLAGLALLALPLARVLREPTRPTGLAQAAPVAIDSGAWHLPLRQPVFWCLSVGFMLCGFHVTFVITHMPGFIERCGLPAAWGGPWLAVLGGCSLVGSLMSGAWMHRLGPGRLLAALYLGRALGIVAVLAGPIDALSLFLFALVMGLSYMSALPPLSNLLAERFGHTHHTRLLGWVMCLHQLGAFAGAWMGGVVMEHTGSYVPVWVLDAALALFAAALQWPLIERRGVRRLSADPAGAVSQ